MLKHWLIVLIFAAALPAQNNFSVKERLQGYKIADNSVIFIFDETLYGVHPDRVAVEGSFRGWEHDMSDSRWWLKPVPGQSGLWVLETKEDIPVRSEFKFRINDGDWMPVPAGAKYTRGGNLVFEQDKQKLTMRAEMVGKRNVRIRFEDKNTDISYDPADYRLFGAEGIEVPVGRVFYIQPGEIQLWPREDLDIRRVHFVEAKRQKLRSPVYFDGWFRHVYSEKKLGAFYDATTGKTIFRLFAPRANAVKLYLYREPEQKHFAVHSLNPDENHVWEIALPGNLEGVYYDYTVHGFDEPGNHFYESNPVHITDPYGQVSVDSFGPCRVWPDVKPPRPVKGGRPKMEDVIAYEVHVQDFTRYLPVDEKKRGTFTGFMERGLRNSKGEKIGFDHLVDLGINVVHLQPVQEFLHFPDKEWRETFKDDPYMIEQEINLENYQWGYRITHFFAIESRYREKGSEWGAQNKQFRDLVQALHDQGIAVIVDVVFNHTGERMDQRMDYFNFSVIDKLYYYRTNKNLDYIGEYGTEIKSEERPMVQRWLIDQCENLINQYGVDGFRIDLAGQTDKQTLAELKRRLGPDILIYGEPWIASADPNFENNPDWDWYKSDAPITYFQDEARNAFKGPTGNPQDKWKDRGFAGGNGERDKVKLALTSRFPEDDTPIDGISYLDIHDNWALADRFAREDWDGRKGVDEARVKIAATLLMTTLGPVVLHGGTEILRSKASAPLEEIVKTFQGGPIYIHGKRDTYNLARANAFIWENKGKSIGDDDGAIKCNYDNMYKFWRGLIGFRRSDYGKLFRLSEHPAPDYYRWYEPLNSRLLGYMVAGKILVLINTDVHEGVFENITLPGGGDWMLIADIDSIDWLNGLPGRTDSWLQGGSTHSFPLPAESLKIWVRQ